MYVEIDGRKLDARLEVERDWLVVEVPPLGEALMRASDAIIYPLALTGPQQLTEEAIFDLRQVLEIADGEWEGDGT